MRTVLLLCTFFLLTVVAFAATPTELSYQGYLTDGAGDPVADGSYSIVFTIYDAASGGDSKWTETQNVTTVEGLFSVLLGSVTPILDTVFADSGRWLGLAVDGDPEIAPRTKLTTSAFAFRVARLDGAKGGTITGDVDIQGDARIGTGHGTSGSESFVAGRLNTASGFRSTVSGGSGNEASGANSAIGGGSSNDAIGDRSTVAGGHSNTASGDTSVVGGGSRNTASGNHATVGGGQHNEAAGDYSFTAGYADSIHADADHSVLFGIDSDLTQDSTFMVDMPHVRIGDETTGYELPTEDGADGQVLGTDGAGQAGWLNAPAGGGSTFIRWGNSAAPAGATLIYSGFGYAGERANTGPVEPFVIQGGDPGGAPTGATGLLYPLSTAVGDQPACIPNRSFFPAAVCFTASTALTIWGSHTAPSGWEVLYTGYALGPYHNFSNPVGPICVECEDFEFVDASSAGTNLTFIYGLAIDVPATGDGDLVDEYIKCAVIKKQ